MRPAIARQKQPVLPTLTVGGFTLVELMIAIFILSIIMVTLFGSFNAVFTQSEPISRKTRLAHMGQNCLNRIADDLKQLRIASATAYAKPIANSDPDTYRFLADTQYMAGEEFPRLQFVTGAQTDQSGKAPFQYSASRVTYYVQQSREGVILRRADHHFPFGEFKPVPEDPVVCTHLNALKLTFFDAEGEGRSEWDSDDEITNYATPVSVEIELALGKGAESMILTTRVALATVRDGFAQI
jgi:general secretion pathway protein J